MTQSHSGALSAKQVWGPFLSAIWVQKTTHIDRVINFNIRLMKMRQLLTHCRVHALSFLPSHSEDFIAPCLCKLLLARALNGVMADWDTCKWYAYSLILSNWSLSVWGCWFAVVICVLYTWRLVTATRQRDRNHWTHFSVILRITNWTEGKRVRWAFLRILSANFIFGGCTEVGQETKTTGRRQRTKW